MSKGIVIIALGHPFYGRMALNLAVSLKASAPVPIALVHNKTSLTHLSRYELKDYFDLLLEVPEESYTINGKMTPVKAKTYLYDFSPFDETLFFDADTLWVSKKTPLDLFADLKDVPFTMANHNYYEAEKINEKTNVWGRVHEVKQAYGFTTGKYYSLSSEVIYFKKTDQVKNYFDKAKEVFEKPLVIPTRKKSNGKSQPVSFAGYLPDEFAFSVASILTDLYPHVSPYLPSYWFSVNSRNQLQLNDIRLNYYLLSIGGKNVPRNIRKYYNIMASHVFQKMGLRYPWLLNDNHVKRSFLPERLHI